MGDTRIDPTLPVAVRFDNAGVWLPRKQRRSGGGRRQRIRRLAGESRKEQVWHLRNATFDVPVGSSVAVVGRKGSGREELLRLAGGTLIPDEGRVQRRQPVLPMVEVARALSRNYTVRQNVYVVGGLLGMTPDQVHEHVTDIARAAGLEGSLDKYLGAQRAIVRQKMAWSIAMAAQAPAYAVFETLLVGDDEFRDHCRALIRQRRDQGVTFLIATDVEQTLRDFCDSAVLLDQGQFVGQMPVDEALDRLKALSKGPRREEFDEADDDEDDDDL